MVDIDWLKDSSYGNNPRFQKMAPEQRAAAMAFRRPQHAADQRHHRHLHRHADRLPAVRALLPGGGEGHEGAARLQALVLDHVLVVAARSLLNSRRRRLHAAHATTTRWAPASCSRCAQRAAFSTVPSDVRARRSSTPQHSRDSSAWILSIIGVRTFSQRSWSYSAIFALIPVVLIYGIWAFFAFR